MSKPASPEEYRAQIQGYVGGAHVLADAIINRVLAGEDSSTYLRAKVFDEPVLGRERIRTLWGEHRMPGLTTVETDSRLEHNRRLGLTYNLVGGRVLRAWVYKADEQDKGDADRQPTPAAPDEWVDEEVRNALSRLVLPGYRFVESGLDGSPDDFSRTFVMAYLFTEEDRRAGRNVYYDSCGIGNIPREQYESVVAPHITPEDRALLDAEGNGSYHRAKIEEMLKIMGHVAHRAV